MKGKRSVIAFVFIISALIVGSFQVSAQATDPGAAADSGSDSFADSVPQIPGYNAPYPAWAMQSSGKVLAKLVQATGASADLGSKGPSDGFAVTVPSIPGYNASNPVTAEIATGPEMARIYGYAETAPAIPGYNVPYPVQAAQNPAKVLAKPIRVTDSPSISTALSFYGLLDGFATSVPQIPGYNTPYPTQTSQSVSTP